MTSQTDEYIIRGEPTKEFFIFMLTRDISLIQAIADLTDNCVDGARRLHPKGDFKDLWIRIEIDSDHFKISDNCGGIPLETAKNYAFRFGRPQGTPNTSHSIGQFGVGMKRAFFKIGTKFEVTSTTEDCRFRVIQDIEDWAAQKESWDFRFNMVQKAPQPKKLDRGTTITVTSLFKGVSSEFKLENFRTRLHNSLASAHQEAIRKGINITLNGEPLQAPIAKLFKSDEITPSRKSITYGKALEKVSAILYCGLSESNPSEAGWSIFCNGRLVLEADKSRLTGWGDGNPVYHNEYARFRGYVFFDSDMSYLLPWTTTKSSVNTESEYFQAIRNEIKVIMRPVINFLIKVAAEKRKSEDDEPTQLELTIKNSTLTSIQQITKDSQFSAPQKAIVSAKIPKTNRIQYSKPVDSVRLVKKSLGVTTLKEVGERTFEYYMEMECEEE